MAVPQGAPIRDLAGRIAAQARGWAAKLPNRERLILILLLLVVTALWAFVELAEEVIEGETRVFDEAVLLALRDAQDLADPLGPIWLQEFARDLTALGGVAVLTFLTLAACGFLLLQGKRHGAVLMLAAIGGGILLSSLLKIGFDRPRPELVPHGTLVYTASFPSGHSMMSAIVYLTLGALLARLQPNRRLKVYLLGLALLLALAVGMSRLYLGVHWPTDVLAGWSVGAAWALLCWAIALFLQRTGMIESDTPGQQG